MFRALNIKLWRDLVHLRAQALTIGVVVACGVAGFVGEFSTHESLKGSRDAYYLASRFADVFASVRRAAGVAGSVGSDRRRGASAVEHGL